MIGDMTSLNVEVQAAEIDQLVVLVTEDHMHHAVSIQQQMTCSSSSFKSALIDVYWYTFQDIKHQISKHIKKEFTRNLMNLSFGLVKEYKIPPRIFQIASLVFRVFGFRGLLFYKLSLVSGACIRKGESLLEVAKSKN